MRHLRLPTVITRADVPTAVFGGWDGCISVLAVMIGLAFSRHGAGAVVAGCSGAIGGTFSMASGQWKSDKDEPDPDPRRVRLRRAMVMAVATGAGGMIPVVPFWLPLPWWAQALDAVVLSLLFATAVTVVEARNKRDRHRWPSGAELRETYGLLIATAAATYAVGLL